MLECRVDRARGVWLDADIARAGGSQMARQILGSALRRCGDSAGRPLDSGAPLTQFLQIGGEWLPSSTEVEATERPPMRYVLAPNGQYNGASRGFQDSGLVGPVSLLRYGG